MRYVTEFAATIPNASPSMRLDHLAGRPSEVDVINGAVVELSRELGLDAPYNETLCAVLRPADPSQAWPRPRGHRLDLAGQATRVAAWSGT